MTTDHETLSAEVRKAIEQGLEIQEMVRQLTLRKISARSLDIASLRQIADSVLKGAREAVRHELNLSAAQTKTARTQLKLAVAGLEAAFAQLADASKLAVEEATSRAQKFSGEDLTRASNDLKGLEALFIETVQTSASASRDAAGEILHDLAAHARTHGTAINAQLTETLDIFAHQLSATGQAQAAAGLHLAQATSDLLRQIGAGVLSGLADHVKPDKPH
jgi:hypothetical protein